MNISARDRILIGVVAALAVLAGFYLLALKPQRDQANRLATSIAAAQKQLIAAQSQYETGRAAEQRLRDSLAEFSAAQRAVPGTPDIPALLTLLQHTADQAHVSIQSITPGSSQSGSSTTATTTAPATTTSAATSTTSGTTGTGSTTAGASAATAETVPVSLTFTGGYQALNRMVRALDTLVVVSHGKLHARGPLVGIGSVTLAPGNSSGGGALSVQLSATIYQMAAATSASGSTTGASSASGTTTGASASAPTTGGTS